MGTTGGFGAMSIMSLGNAYAQGISQKAQSDYTAAQYGINAKLAGEQAKIATEDGDLQAGQMALQTKVNVAKQRVASAATGADANSGSALNLQSDTNWQGQQNQIMIKNNAWRQAWGLGVQASSDTNQASLSTLAGKNQLNNSYLTGGMNAFGYGVQGYGAWLKNNGSAPSTISTTPGGTFAGSDDLDFGNVS